jgi:hypothetical protein
MKRAAPVNREPTAGPQHLPDAGLVLREVAVLMRPVAVWLLRNGVAYPAFAEALKSVFLQAARGELERDAVEPTQSALSLLSGLHRKDVRARLQSPADAERALPRPTLASQVLTRWLTDRRYLGADGKPRTLARSGEKRSFESLCRDLSNDVHPRTVLEELLRLGQVAVDGDNVVVLAHSYIPSERLEELTALFSSNAADHLAAAVSNLSSRAPKFLEQSIYADGLKAESIDQLHLAARAAWASAFESVVTQSRKHVDQDAGGDGHQRMRFGVYFFSEAAPAPDGAPADRRNNSATPRSAKGRKRTPP